MILLIYTRLNIYLFMRSMIFFSTTEITSFKDFFFFDPRQTTKGGVISIYISYLKMTKKNTQPTKHWESEQQLTMLRTRHTITT